MNKLLVFAITLLSASALIAEEACLLPPSGMVGWWPLDETTGVVAEDIVGSNDGTHSGGPTPVSGAVAGALSFDGVDDEVIVGSTFPFHDATDVTLDFWVRTTATGHQSVFWTRADSSDENRYNFFINDDSTFGFDYREANGNIHILVGQCCTGISIARNEWTHLAITRVRETGGSDRYSLYVNGDFAADAADPSPSLPTAPGWKMSGRPGYWFDGELDEVEVFDRALSASEIRAIFDAGASGKCKPLGDKPTNPYQCKKDGWMNYGFKNQGDCMQFVNTGK